MDTFLEAEKRTIMAKDNKNKQFTELSDEELKQVTGGASIDCSLPENKDNVKCSVKLMGLGENQFETQIQFENQNRRQQYMIVRPGPPTID